MDDSGPSRRPDDEHDFSLEVTPLSSPATPARTRRLATPNRRTRRVWLAVLTGAVLVAFALAVGLVPATRDALTARFATPTTTPHLVQVGTQLGPVPTNCPPGNSVTVFSPDYPPGVGVSGLDVWLVGFTGSNATLRPGFEPTADGFPATLEAVVGRDVTQLLTLKIQPIFGAAPTEAFASLTLDPKTMHTAPDGYRTQTWHISLPGAGCYYLAITGSAGTFFAAGG